MPNIDEIEGLRDALNTINARIDGIASRVIDVVKDGEKDAASRALLTSIASTYFREEFGAYLKETEVPATVEVENLNRVDPE